MIFEMTEKQYQLFLHVMQVMQTFYGNNFSSICKEIGDAYGVNDADIEKAYMIFTDFKVTAPVPTMQNAAGKSIRLRSRQRISRQGTRRPRILSAST